MGSNPDFRFAVISQGRLFVFEKGALTEVASTFAEKMSERERASFQRHAWKGQGNGFLPMWGKGQVEKEFRETPKSVSSVAAVPGGGAFYTLQTTGVCALLKLNGEGGEDRIWHSNAAMVTDLAPHPDGSRVACVSLQENGTSRLALMRSTGGGVQELTEGDSVDLCPSWVHDEPEKVVFQSAGIGRSRDGFAQGMAPFEIHELDLTTGEMETLAAGTRHDFLAPRYDAEGRLHFIRRPYRTAHSVNPLRWMLDVVLIPFRLLQAVFGWLNFFSMMWGGKPLKPGGAAKMDGEQMKKMLVWGSVIDAAREAKMQPGAEDPDLVPKTWELVRREKNGAESVIARGVLSYDFLPSGGVLFSNGSAVFHRAADGAVTRVVKQGLIERVAAL